MNRDGKIYEALKKEFLRLFSSDFTANAFSICGLYYKSFTIVIYNLNNRTIVIYDHNDSGLNKNYYIY